MKINNWAKCLILHRFVSEWIKWSFIIIDALIFFKVSLRYFETNHIQACFSSKSAVSLWCLTAKLNAALLLLLLIRRYHQTHRRPFIIKWSLATVCLSFVFNARELGVNGQIIIFQITLDDVTFGIACKMMANCSFYWISFGIHNQTKKSKCREANAWDALMNCNISIL